MHWPWQQRTSQDEWRQGIEQKLEALRHDIRADQETMAEYGGLLAEVS